jgi:hypothetical protein
MDTYQMIEGTQYIAHRQYTLYGIRCDHCEFKNISLDKESVKQLVERCNCLKLEKIHLRDVVEDFIAEKPTIIFSASHV